MGKYIDEDLAFKWKMIIKNPDSILYIKDAIPEMQLEALSKNPHLIHVLEDPSKLAQKYVFKHEKNIFLRFANLQPEKVKIEYKSH